MPRLCSTRQPNSELASSPANREGQDTSYANHRDRQRDACNAAEDQRIEAIWRQHFRADVVECGSVFNRLVGGHLTNDARDGSNQPMRIDLSMDEQAATEERYLFVGFHIRNLAKRVVNREHSPGNDMFVVHVGSDSHDATRPGADKDELHDRVRPDDVVVNRVLAGEHPLRNALADNYHRLAASFFVLGEVAAAQQRDAERREKARGDNSKLGTRAFLASAFRMALARELESGTKSASVAPRNLGTEGNAVHTGQCTDAADGLPVEVDDLFGRLSKRHYRHVQRENARHVETGLLRLQREQGLDEDAGPGQQDK